MKKIIILGALLLIGSHLTSNIQRICPNEETIQKLKDFHSYTSSSGDNKPDISELIQKGRTFIAKMDSFGMDRYFSFETNADIEELVEGVMRGGGMGLNWYYLDTKEEKKLNPDEVNITGLPKEELAKALFRNARPLGMGFLAFKPNEELSDKEAHIIATSYADYVHGRLMKIDISGDTVNTRLYNRDNGQNAAEKVIETLRAKLVDVVPGE
ncbi:MAG: hypothetical protein WCT20_03865 [Candidatus Babeliales bacterium]